MQIKNNALNILAAALLGGAVLPASAQDITTLADFEAGTGTNNTSGSWYFVDDAGNGGNSKITSGDTTSKPPIWNSESVAAPGNANSKYSAKFSFTFGDKLLTCGDGCVPYQPEVMVGTDIRPADDTVLNLTGATKLTFFAKAEPAMSVTIVYVSADITDYSYFRRTTQINTQWREYTVLMGETTNISSPGWGQSSTRTPAWNQAKAVNFSISKSFNSSVPGGTLFIDDVKIHNWKPSGVSIRKDAIKAAGSQAIHRLLEGGSMRFAIPEAYRKASGKVAVVDLSGKVLAEARFARGQEGLDLSLPRTTSTSFLRVIPD